MINAIIRNYRYTDKIALENELLAELEEPVLISGSTNTWRSACVYTLPTSPNFLLHFIYALNDIGISGIWRFAISPIAHYLKKSGATSSFSMQKYIEISDFRSEKNYAACLINQLCRFKNVPDRYSLTVTSIAGIHGYYPGKTHISIEDRMIALWHGLAHTLVKPSITSTEKLNQLFAMARRYISAGLNNDLNYMLATFQHFAIKKYFANFICEIAHDKGRYDWDYSEWKFLSFSEFTMRADGCLCINNIKNNPKYKELYAKGKVNADLLEPELKYLTKLQG